MLKRSCYCKGKSSKKKPGKKVSGEDDDDGDNEADAGDGDCV